MQSYKTLPIAAAVPLFLLGCALLGPRKPEVALRIHEQADAATPASHVVAADIPTANLRIPVDEFPTITETDVESASVFQTAGGPGILLRFDPNGTFKLDEMTTRDRGRYLVTYLDGRPVAAWFVDQRLTKGEFRVEGEFSDEQAKKAVDALNRMSKKR